jgi:hypothetical protein
VSESNQENTHQILFRPHPVQRPQACLQNAACAEDKHEEGVHPHPLKQAERALDLDHIHLSGNENEGFDVHLLCPLVSTSLLPEPDVPVIRFLVKSLGRSEVLCTKRLVTCKESRRVGEGASIMALVDN